MTIRQSLSVGEEAMPSNGNKRCRFEAGEPRACATRKGCANRHRQAWPRDQTFLQPATVRVSEFWHFFLVSTSFALVNKYILNGFSKEISSVSITQTNK